MTSILKTGKKHVTFDIELKEDSPRRLKRRKNKRNDNQIIIPINRCNYLNESIASIDQIITYYRCNYHNESITSIIGNDEIYFDPGTN